MNIQLLIEAKETLLDYLHEIDTDESLQVDEIDERAYNLIEAALNCFRESISIMEQQINQLN